MALLSRILAAFRKPTRKVVMVTPVNRHGRKIQRLSMPFADSITFDNRAGPSVTIKALAIDSPSHSGELGHSQFPFVLRRGDTLTMHEMAKIMR